MSRPAGRKKRNNREEGKRLFAFACAVLLCASALSATLAARVNLTALSQETAAANTEIAQLQLSLRKARARFAGENSYYLLAEQAEELGYVSPGECDAVFVPRPHEDMTLCHPGYETKRDKPKTIWEYFG